MYAVINIDKTKRQFKQSYSFEAAITLYDSVGGNAAGYRIVKFEEAIKEEVEEIDEPLYFYNPITEDVAKIDEVGKMFIYSTEGNFTSNTKQRDIWKTYLNDEGYLQTTEMFFKVAVKTTINK